MITTLTQHRTVAAARLVSPISAPTTRSWQGDTTVSAAVATTTGLEFIAPNAYGVEAMGGICPVDGAKRFTTRHSRHLAPRST